MAFNDYQSSVIPGAARYGLSPGSLTDVNKTQFEDGGLFFIVHYKKKLSSFPCNLPDRITVIILRCELKQRKIVV